MKRRSSNIRENVTSVEAELAVRLADWRSASPFYHIAPFYQLTTPSRVHAPEIRPLRGRTLARPSCRPRFPSTSFLHAHRFHAPRSVSRFHDFQAAFRYAVPCHCLVCALSHSCICSGSFFRSRRLSLGRMAPCLPSCSLRSQESGWKRGGRHFFHSPNEAK